MSEPRDHAVDRLLKAELGRPGGETTPQEASACVDAETFAAWVDGVLPPRQATSLEMHMADCPRCQGMIAAFAKTESAAAAVAVAPRTERAWFRWLMPVAAGAAAITLAVWLTWSSTPSTSSTPVSTAPASQMAQADTKQKAEAPPPAPAPGQAKLNDRAKEAAGGAKGQRADANAALEKEKLAKKDQADKDAANKRTQQAETRLRAEPSPPPVPVAVGGAVTLPAAQPIPVAPPPARPTEPPPPTTPPASTAAASGAATTAASRDTVTTQAPVYRAAAESFNERPAGVIAEFSSPTSSFDQQAGSGAAGGGGGRGGGGAGRGGAVGGVVGGLSATGSRQWRIYATGVVEQSNNGGSSWEKITLEPEIRVTAGAAPSLNVCWLAGREGAVLISLNASRFNKLVFPEPVDLTSIRATNAREAIVTTADGRAFVTSDGGITWTVRQ